MNGQSIGLVGCGRWGKNILRDLISLGSEVIVCDPSPKSRQDALDLGAADVVSEVYQLSDSIEGFVIASPAGQHYSNILSLLPRGKPIFVEKPLTTIISDADTLANLKSASDLVFVMHKWRYHPGIKCLKDLVSSNRFGNVVGIRLQRTNWAATHDDVDCALQLLPHDLSIVLHLIGYIPPLQHVSPNPLGGPRFGLMISLYDPMKQIRIQIEANNFVPGNLRSCTIGFETAVACYSSNEPNHVVVRQHQDSLPLEICVPNRLPLFEELASFLGYINGGPLPLSSIHDELAIMQRIEQSRTHLYAA